MCSTGVEGSRTHPEKHLCNGNLKGDPKAVNESVTLGCLLRRPNRLGYVEDWSPMS